MSYRRRRTVSDIGPHVPQYVPAPQIRRIVLRHPSGLHQILGANDQQPEAFGVVTLNGKLTALSLIAAKPRYYLFTIVDKPEGLGQFHSEQR